MALARPRAGGGGRRVRGPAVRPRRPGRSTVHGACPRAGVEGHLGRRAGEPPAGRLSGDVDEPPSPHTAAATCPRSVANWRPRCGRAGCSASRPRPPSSSGSTSPAWTPSCSRAGPARGPRCGSRPDGRGGPVPGRWPCSSPPTTRSTPTSSTIPTRCSGPRSRRRSSTPRTPTCSVPTSPRLPPSCPSPRRTSLLRVVDGAAARWSRGFWCPAATADRLVLGRGRSAHRPGVAARLGNHAAHRRPPYGPGPRDDRRRPFAHRGPPRRGLRPSGRHVRRRQPRPRRGLRPGPRRRPRMVDPGAFDVGVRHRGRRAHRRGDRSGATSATSR